MKLGREHAIGAIAAVALAVGGAWVVQRTEWVEKQVAVEATREERRDPQHRLKRVLTQLGARVSAPGTLDTMPPRHATLVLTSWHWNLFPERSLTLRRWVEAGGDLVLPYTHRRNGGIDWLAVDAVPLLRTRGSPGLGTDARSSDDSHRNTDSNDASDSDSDSDEDNDDGEAAPPVFGRAASDARCASLREPAGAAPAFGTHRTFATCLDPGRTLQTKLPVSWALAVPQGPVVLRVPAGHGSVTLTGLPMPWDNARVLELDNALIAAAVMRAAPGREIWFVSNQDRLPLLTLLWQRGAPALLLGALALGFALWRGAVRFGPRAAAAPTARRSVAEQIRGTSGFIASHGGGAGLHAAQLRALHDAARQRLAGFDALAPDARATAIARACGVDAPSLARAMQPQLTPALARHPAPALALLETARRRLLNAPRAGAPKPTPTPNP